MVLYYPLMKPITASILVACGASPAHASKYVEPINAYIDRYQVNTLPRLAHFISQILHESIGLSATVENLNYSAEALVKTWPKRFPTVDFAKRYARQPERIANYVYANRLGNGPVESGDGWKFRGRGPIQMTGKDKAIALTKLFGEEFDVDYVENPELLERPDDGIRAAFWFWKTNNINQAIDKVKPESACEVVTLIVNGGQNGLQSRKILFARCINALAPLFS